MSKFCCNSRVIVKLDGEVHRGRVTRVLNQRRKVVTDSGRRIEVPVRRLKASPDRVLILETRLDRSFQSDRTYGPMMQQWLAAYDVQTLYEQVHTKETIERFLRREGRHVATRFIHIMGHGTSTRRNGKAKLHLTFGKLDLAEDADIFAGLDGKVIIFSCCEVGADLRAMEAVKEASGAAAVIGYRVVVEDWYTNLSEVILYDRLLNTTMTPQSAAEVVNELLEYSDVRPESQIVRKPVLVCV